MNQCSLALLQENFTLFPISGSSKVIVADSEVETHHKAGDMIETSDFATVR